MIPSLTDNSRNKLNFGILKGRKVIANFTGGRITSDAGIVLLAELDKKLQITKKFTQCFRDYRSASYTDYSVHQLLAQRVYGIILGYEDVNDHDKMRYDPALAIALGKLNSINPTLDILAGKSTINRLEYCPETITNQKQSRYHKIEHDPKQIEKAFVEIFLASYSQPPREIVLDMDVTDDQVHGTQEGAFFNSYYKGVCYAPLYIFCGHHLLVAKLRSSNVDPAEGALPELKRIIRLIREKWQNTHIIIRGDSAYSREDIMKWSEEQPRVDYILAMATNSQLNQLRLWLSSMAYVLVQAFRQNCLRKTSLEKATVGTIRLSIFKLGARITISCRRILIAIATACPYQDILKIANLRIQAIPDSG